MTNDHQITITPFDGTITVSAGDTNVATSERAFVLRESGYPPRYYIPLNDVIASTCQGSDTATHCHFKGDATYFNVVTDDNVIIDAAWCYRDPVPEVVEIKSHLSFDENLVTVQFS